VAGESEAPDKVKPSDATTEGSDDQPPSWFRQYQQDVDGRMKKLVADLSDARKAIRKQEPSTDSQASKEAPRAVTESDLHASRRLGRIQAQLPPSAADEVDAMLESGGSTTEALRLAEFLVKHSPGADATSPGGRESGATPGLSGGATPPPRGHGATPAPSSAQPNWPTSFSELQALKKRDPAAFDRVYSDPAFDPSRLSRS